MNSLPLLNILNSSEARSRPHAYHDHNILQHDMISLHASTGLSWLSQYLCMCSVYLSPLVMEHSAPYVKELWSGTTWSKYNILHAVQDIIVSKYNILPPAQHAVQGIIVKAGLFSFPPAEYAFCVIWMSFVLGLTNLTYSLISGPFSCLIVRIKLQRPALLLLGPDLLTDSSHGNAVMGLILDWHGCRPCTSLSGFINGCVKPSR